eukprot:TRINITY_DN7317_c0_g1_i1.p1 TRINITY_DN7317_c0_g1~~TRINITY_DN7317_c0_g1_i1.p1  ORF type:complete len:170 (+),score=58.09 TRINITY_DN7317_c0_g1_i1:36-545(+)
MSWMDFKTAQAMKAQKLNENSKRSNIAVQKGTGEKPTTSLDSISVKSALSVPKKGVAQGVHKADSRVAPEQSRDFSVNQSGGDQSTENNPESSNISYDSHRADQSTENNPENSGIEYESHGGDQSTENNPEYSGIEYDSHGGDQSTENNPDDSHVQYDSYNADQSTENY